MRKPMGRSLLLGLPSFGLLACSAKIDEVAHGKLGGEIANKQRLN